MSESNQARYRGIRRIPGADPLPLIYHIDAMVFVNNSDLTPGAGTIRLNGTAVPAGKRQLITQVAAFNNTSAASSIDLLYSDGTTDLRILRKVSPAIGEPATIFGWLWLDAAGLLKADFNGTVAGDDLYLQYTGIQITRITDG